MRRQTRCVGHEAGFGNDPSELQAKSTSIRERSSSLGQTIHRPRRDDRRSSPYQAQCSGTFVDDASAIGFWERLVQVNRLAIQANSFTEMECVFVVLGGSSPTRQLYSSKQFGVVFGVGTRKRACGSESSSVDCIFAHRQWASTTWLRSRLLGQMPQKPDTGLPTK